MRQVVWPDFTCTTTVGGKERVIVIKGKKTDEFLNTTNCPRCGEPLFIRTMSWFNHDTICMDCSAKEDTAKAKLRELGKDPAAYEGCGFIPQEVIGILAVVKNKGGDKKG